MGGKLARKKSDHFVLGHKKKMCAQCTRYFGKKILKSKLDFDPGLVMIHAQNVNKKMVQLFLKNGNLNKNWRVHGFSAHKIKKNIWALKTPGQTPIFFSTQFWAPSFGDYLLVSNV